MAGLVGLWNRLRTRTRRTVTRRVSHSGLSYERYGIDLLEKRQMLAVTPASDFTYTTSNGQVAITKYVGSSTTVEIPATIDTMPVTSIGNTAFYMLASLTSVTIPASVTSIGISSFDGCTSLTSVAIPGTVTTIGGKAFYFCTSLTGVAIGSGVQGIGTSAFDGCTSLLSVSIPGTVTTIGDKAFYFCTSLASVTIGSGVRSIGTSAFDACTSLSSVEIPGTVTSIREKAFSFCTSLPAVAIPAGLTAIGANAFIMCTSLSRITLPMSVTSLGDGAFSWCSALKNVTIPEELTSIPANLFSNCKSLTSVTIPSSVTSIGRSAFAQCLSLSSVTIPSGITSVGQDAFLGCTSLTGVTVPSSVVSIGQAAFAGCTILTSIDVATDNAAFSSRDGVLYTKDGKTLVQWPAGKGGNVVIPSGITSIGNYAFYRCTGLTGVTIPIGVTSIRSGAFQDCTTLATVVVPVGVTTIRDRAFQGCTSLTSVALPSGITSIGDYAFFQCSGLASITIPSSVASIGEWALAQCAGLTSVIIASTATTLGTNALFNCTRLTTVTISGSVTTVGDGAFAQCTSLTSIAIPEGATNIGKGAFFYCEGLKSVAIPSSVASIGETAFYYCTSLTGVTISPGVTSIGKNAFSYCVSLVNLFLPPTVQYLGEYAFDSSSLQGVYFYGDAPQVDPGVSLGGNGVTMYHLPGTSGWTTQYTGAITSIFPDSMAPMAVVGIRGNGQVQLSWTAPVSNGGLSVTDYTIQYSSNSGSSWQTFSHVASVATRATVTGLTNGTGYLFRVAAVNDVGTGLYSANSSAVTPATTPGLPTTVVGIRGNGQVQLSWTAPVSSGGLSVTDYTIQYSTDGTSWQTFGHVASVATRATVTGLTNGTGYLIRVAAVNDVGTGLFTSTVSKIVPGLVPPPPSGLVAIRGNGVVTLSWSAPLPVVGIRVVDYAVQYSTNGGVSWVTVRDGISIRPSAVISGLAIGRDHIFRVASVSRGGMGDFSSPTGVVSPATVPQAPLRVMAAAGVGQVIVSWSLPASNGGSGITQYLIQYAALGGRWVTAPSVGANTTAYTVSGLASNRQYSFRVLAVNEIGAGAPSRVAAARTLRVSAALART